MPPSASTGRSGSLSSVDNRSIASHLALPSGRAADTPLEIAACLLRRSLESPNELDFVKQALHIIEGIDEYTAAASTPASDSLLKHVETTMRQDWDAVYQNGHTKFHQSANCCAGSFEAAFVSSMVSATRATRVLEVGMFTGTTTMAIAEALPTHGKVYTLEIEPYLAKLAQNAFDAANLADKIEIKLGDGAESLSNLAHQGISFDLIFIDADKQGYRKYYDTIMKSGLLSPKGTLIVDNTLFKGKYLLNQPVSDDPNAEALRLFNQHVLSDKRVSVVVLPIRDGVSVITRRSQQPDASSDSVILGEGGLDILQRLKLSDKVSLVTGAGQGIGRAFAHALGEAGAAVAVVDIAKVKAEVVAKELKAKGIRSIAVGADVTKKSDCVRMVEETLTAWGHLDIAVNNAGVNFNGAAEDITDIQWDTTFNVNTKGVLYCCQAEARYMLQSQRPCSIINTASMATLLVPHPQKQAAYNSSKAAVVKLTQSLAVEWADRGVRVNAISPGIVNTALIQENPDLKPLVKTWLGQIPLNRLAEVTDLQAAVVYLASDASSYLTGQNLGIEGGQSVI
ncbi:uncharacterized protein EV422DRAFT_511846 [Fimicolochytrium jonesii]|uniref:uncharacterized protein n=1 Tax=Fimicolochytrium jonesii TaxID=1396493 RepID=UPI0022FED6F9|nr:uncharacterized protein EV422DRAFT_511846 [Fimicolochytrium jonesii]KAI8826905.1 hypothetical protein EV422DRAFT_511846 [Fimicolochytrium jonesii]